VDIFASFVYRGKNNIALYNAYIFSEVYPHETDKEPIRFVCSCFSCKSVAFLYYLFASP